MEKKLTRSFGGNFKLITDRKNTPEAQFEKKHLKAYLKGKKLFNNNSPLVLKRMKNPDLVKVTFK